MNRNLFATCILALAFASAASAQGTASSPETDPHYTKAQLKQLTLSADAPAQYSALASYFSKQRENYLQKAAEKQKEWVQLSQYKSAAAKYPRPADSVRNYYEYYMQKASEAGTLEAKYSRLAAPNAPVTAE